MLSHSALRRRFEIATQHLGVSTPRFTYQTRASHDGSAHIELIGDRYEYVRTERGCEIQRRLTSDPDELMYWLLNDVTFGLASDFELANRVPHQDCRHILFAKQIELMTSLNPLWGERLNAELGKILKHHPYSDATRA